MRFELKVRLSRRTEVIAFCALLLTALPLFVHASFAYPGIYPFVGWVQVLLLLIIRLRCTCAAIAMLVQAAAWTLGMSSFGESSRAEPAQLFIVLWTGVLYFFIFIFEHWHRTRFVQWVAWKRSEVAVARHRSAINAILNTLLPGKALRLLLNNRPVVEEADLCTVSVAQIPDYSRWSSMHLPIVGLELIDRCWSVFDELLHKAAAEAEIFLAASPESRTGKALQSSVPRLLEVTGDRYIAVTHLRGQIRNTVGYRRQENVAPAAPTDDDSAETFEAEEHFPSRVIIKVAMQQLRIINTLKVSERLTFDMSVGLGSGRCVGVMTGSRRLVYMARGPALDRALILAQQAGARVLADVDTVRRAGPLRVDEGPATETSSKWNPKFILALRRMESRRHGSSTRIPPRAVARPMPAIPEERVDIFSTSVSSTGSRASQSIAPALASGAPPVQERLTMQRQRGEQLDFHRLLDAQRRHNHIAAVLGAPFSSKPLTWRDALRTLRLAPFADPAVEAEFWMEVSRRGVGTNDVAYFLVWLLTLTTFNVTAAWEGTINWKSAPFLLASCVASGVVLILRRSGSGSMTRRFPYQITSLCGVHLLCLGMFIWLTGPTRLLTSALYATLCVTLSAVAAARSCETRWLTSAAVLLVFGVGISCEVHVIGATTLRRHGLLPVAECFAEILTWLAGVASLRWYEREFRDEFSNKALSGSNYELVKCELDVHRSVLRMLLPEYIVDDVLSKQERSRTHCVLAGYEDCVALEIRLNPSHVDGDDPKTSELVVESQFNHAVLERCMNTAESASPSPGRTRPSWGLITILHMLGDSVLLAGPMMAPPRATFVSLEQSHDVMRRHATMPQPVFEVAGRHTCLALLFTLAALRRELGGRLTGVIASGVGYAAVVGRTQPSYQLLGPVTRIAHDLIAAAPDGFLGASAGFMELLQEYSIAEAEMPSELEVLPSTCWRLRGVGALRVHQLVHGGSRPSIRDPAVLADRFDPSPFLNWPIFADSAAIGGQESASGSPSVTQKLQ